jgi:diketogulonate reductase-like aldo/keto reductase
MMEYRTINNGVKMPVLGFGVFQVADPKVCEESVLTAIRHGYRLIDTAAVYGNEEAVGAAIRKCDVPREELFITTKLWVQDAGYEKTKTAFMTSLDEIAALDSGQTFFGRSEDPQYAKMINSVKIH